MSDSSAPSSEYSGLVGTYTKFMLIKIAILATVISSIFSGSSKLRQFPAEKTDTIKAIRTVTGEYVDQEDFVVEIMLFDASDGRMPTADDSVIVEGMIGSKFPGYSLIKLKQYHVPTDTDKQVSSYLHADLNAIYAQLKKVSDSAFDVKVSVFPDLTFDLRYWAFILPLLLAIGTVYSSSLKFRIAIQQLEDKEAYSGAKNLVSRQYPYLYLRWIFNMVNFALIVLLVISILGVVENFRAHTEIIYYLLTFYSIIFYFTTVYIGTMYKRMVSGHTNAKQLAINKAWNWCMDVCRRIANYIRYKKLIGGGVFFLVFTLFFTMSYNTCSKQGVKDTYKGYELITHPKEYNWQFGDPDFLQILGQQIDRFYQADYMLFFVACSILSILTIRFSKSRKLASVPLKLSVLFFSINFIIFSIYFAMYNGASPVILIAAVSLLFIVLWLRKNFSILIGKPDWDYAVLAETLCIYCFPFLLIAVRQLVLDAYRVIGWVFFFCSILFLVTGCYLMAIKQKKQAGV